ncbi:MAG: amidase [Pseudomonadota bacterium]|nr:amidase [Pseudomonadota bacterium]
MGQSSPLNFLSLQQMLQAIEQQECSATDIINACFDRLESRESEVGAWQYRLSREAYLQHYRAQQSFYQQSLLKGLPVGIKDIFDTADMPTEMGSVIHKGRQPAEDASCVTHIRQAGGIILGKTVTTEFAFFQPGKTANPRDLQRTPGGSSSGSAAAVADGMVPVALGSQTAASVIRPAAYCGAVGYVGSRGEFSLRGAQPLAQSLDSLGLFARSAADIALLRSLLLLQPQTQLQTQRAPRILLCPGEVIGDTDAAMHHALQQAAQRLAAAGAEVTEISNAGYLHDLVTHHATIMGYEVCRNLAAEALHAQDLSTPLAQLMENGRRIPYHDYIAALTAADQACHTLWPADAAYDVVLTPAAPGAAPVGLAATGAPHMSRPWQAMGLPVINLPGMYDDQGLPLGLQLAGRRHADDQLLQIAAWAEAVLSAD